MALELRVNGQGVHLDVDAEMPLLIVLREELGLTGSKPGCGEGQCGACTVLVDGQAVRSCTTPVGTVQGKQILTIEGIAPTGELHPLQQAFLDCGAFQCGFCTPGMIMSAAALLNICPNPSEQDIVSALDGNICRCGTYLRITRAIQQAAAATQAQSAEEARR
jgi:aerobic-type carbon monoxide dehydrogenase small subunit (CoxS/CutS family)